MTRLPLAWILTLPLAVACSGDKGDDTSGDTATDSGSDSGTDSEDSGTDSGSTSYDQTDFLTSAADASFIGEAQQDAAGVMVGAPGDLDGDGQAEMAIGAQFNSDAGTWNGAVYIEMGSSAPSGVISLEETDTILTGEASGDRLGTIIAPGSDVDGDGRPDLIFGTPLSNTAATAAGAAFVVLSDMALEGGEVSLSDAAGKIYGDIQLDRAGVGVAGLGDIDGDGTGEIVVGVSGDDLDQQEGGAVYVFSGAALMSDGVSSPASAALGFAGELEDDALGAKVCGPGDLDGDGLGDLVVGRPGHDDDDTGYGAVYFFMSGGALQTSGVGSVTDADSTITGAEASELAGSAIAGVGDVDGDGKADLLVGAPWADVGDQLDAGAAYLMLSSGTLQTMPRTFANYDMRFEGVKTLDDAGQALAAAGDVDADGKADVLISTISADFSTTASSPMYLLLTTGVLSEGSGVWSLTNADGAYRTDVRADSPGYALTGLGDADGDGYGDLLFGAYAYDYLEFGDQRVDSGAAFLFYGFTAAQ